MKYLIIFLILCCFEINGIAQNQKFPNGVYLNLEQLKSKTPAFDANLEVIKRTKGDIGFNGGNDYEIKSSIDSIKKKFVKKSIYAYAKNDTLYLNCIQHQLSKWYALCLTQGTFVAFKGSMTNEEANINAGTYGFFFGVIGSGIASANDAKKRYLYILSLRTGNVRSLTKEYMMERLKESQNLVEQFKNEKDQDAESTLIKYIELLNEVIPIDSIAPVQTKGK